MVVEPTSTPTSFMLGGGLCILGGGLCPPSDGRRTPHGALLPASPPDQEPDCAGEARARRARSRARARSSRPAPEPLGDVEDELGGGAGGAASRSGSFPTTPAMAPIDIVLGMQEYGESSQIMWAFFL